MPERGTPAAGVLSSLEELRGHDIDWRSGRSSLHAYQASEEIAALGRAALLMYSSESLLAPTAFPSVDVLRRTVIDAALALMEAPSEAVGVATSGGTESIILAVKAARDRWRQSASISGPPEILAPRSAHPAFEKAGQLLGVEVRRLGLDEGLRGDVAQIAAAISPRTAMIVGSAPCLPYGVIDNLADLARLAAVGSTWLHIDACIGGLLIPFARRAGFALPAVGFAPGVSSISLDFHKFGYAQKGVSAVLYRNEELYRFQSFDFSDWPKGRYRTDTLGGTRSAGALASAYALIQHLGIEGYVDLARRTMALFQRFTAGVKQIGGMKLVGRPEVACFAFQTPGSDPHAVGRELGARGWYVSRLSDPPALHQIVNLLHGQSVDAFLADLRDAARAGAIWTAPRVEEVTTY